MKANLGTLATWYLSPFLARGTVSEALSRAVIALQESRDNSEAVRIVDRSKLTFCELFRGRFSQIEAQALALKTLNLLLAGYHLRARDRVVQSRPFGIVVDPSNVCRLACPGCVHSEFGTAPQFDWPNATLPEARFASLMRLYGPTAIGVYFCNYGEPLLNLNTPQLIRKAKSQLVSAALSTSLSVQRFDADAYVESGLDLMVVSIDGATQSVYERFRRNGDFELVLHNVAKLVASKKKLGRRTPLISWNFLAFQHNFHEIPAAERLARRLGVNCFRVVRPFDVSWDDAEIRPASVKAYVRRLDWVSISNTPENWNPFPNEVDVDAISGAFEKPFGIWTPAGLPANPGRTCHWLYKNIVMDATGRILPCCGAPRPDGQLIFGTLDNNGDPFNSERYCQARAFFRGESAGSNQQLHCYECEWNQDTVNIGAPEIERYFRAADSCLFNRRTVDLLSTT